MTESIADKTTFEKGTIHKVARSILAEGYTLATTSGYLVGSDIDELNKKGIGILQPVSSPKLGFFESFFNALNCAIFGSSERELHIGTLYTNCPERGAENTHWVLDVFGRKKVAPLTKLMNTILYHQEKKPNISIRLAKEQPRIAQYFQDIIDDEVSGGYAHEDYCDSLELNLASQGKTLDDL